MIDATLHRRMQRVLGMGLLTVKKMIECRNQLDWKMRATPDNIMLRIRSLMIIANKSHMQLRFRAIPHHIMIIFYPLIQNIKKY